MKPNHLAALAILVLTVACGRTDEAGPGAALSVAAASDLRYVLDELVATFESGESQRRVSVTYGSSGNFFAQLAAGAPFDLFLSADIAYPRELVALGLTVAESEFAYAEGRLAIWVPASSAIDVEKLGFAALMDPAARRVAIANPAHAPYGRAARAAMAAAGVLDDVEPKLVLGENISQTMQFVQSHSADAGVVALSLALAPPLESAGRFWVVPSSAHPPIAQGGVIMKAARRVDAAWALRAFLMSDRARATLQRYGFETAVSQ